MTRKLNVLMVSQMGYLISALHALCIEDLSNDRINKKLDDWTPEGRDESGTVGVDAPFGK